MLDNSTSDKIRAMATTSDSLRSIKIERLHDFAQAACAIEDAARAACITADGDPEDFWTPPAAYNPEHLEDLKAILAAAQAEFAQSMAEIGMIPAKFMDDDERHPAIMSGINLCKKYGVF